jgi:hypothetical protein
MCVMVTGCSYCYMYQHADTTFERRPKATNDAGYDQLLVESGSAVMSTPRTNEPLLP